MGEALAQFLESVSASLPVWVLLLGACVGHAFLMIVGLNVLYAWPVPHAVLKYTRKIGLLMVDAGPLLFAYALDLFRTETLPFEPGSVRFYLSPYVVTCWLAGF